MKRKGEILAPTPYVEPTGRERFWVDDPWDRHLPSSPGFISDFVAHIRGYEVPTAFALWTAISFLAGAIKREAFLDWGYRRLFANFYVILVGPPATKKGTAMNLLLPIFEASRRKICDHNFAEMKRYNIVRDKATPEFLVSKMSEFSSSRGRYYDFVDQKGEPLLVKGKPVRYTRTSEVFIIVNELATLLGKSDYNRTMIDILLAIYDTLDRWDAGTLKRGNEPLRHLCTNLLGGITPKAMRTSIPETAMDDGFLSRCCLIYQQACAKIYSIPRVAGPSEDELASKLAWIAETNTGRQVLSPGAFNLYDKWYREWREAQNQRIDNSSNASVRMGVQILQLSLILKASRYSQTNIIEEQDIQDAIRIMTETSHTHRLMYERVDSNPFFTKLASLEGFFDKHRKVTRRTVLTNTKFTSDELNILLSHLQQTGKIKIFRGDVESSFVSREGSEIYRWLGLPKTGDESAEEEA